MPSTRRTLLVLVSALTVGAAGAIAPVGNAATTSSIQIKVDGTSLGVSASVTDMSGPRSGIFGGTAMGGTGELTELYASKSGSFVNFTAQGGIVAVSCTPSGTEYYRRAQVTVDNLPSGTNDVWVLYDATVGPNIGAPTPQFNDMGSMLAVSGSSGSPVLTITSGSTSAVAAGDQVNGSGIPAGATVQSVDTSTQLTLDANLTSNVSGNVTVYTERIGTTAGLETLCDGSTRYVTGATGTTTTPGVLTLGSSSGPMSSARNTAGIKVDDTTASSASFDIYVPVDGSGSGSTENFIALGIVVDAGGDGTIDDSTDDAAVFTHVVSPPWDGSGGSGFYSVDLPDCSSPNATAAPCIETGATGLFAAGGTSSLGTYSVTMMAGDTGGEAVAQVEIAPTQAQTDGFAVPAGSIAKMSISWPTSGTLYGIDFSTYDFADAAANTMLKVDPSTTASSSATNRWDISTSGGRVITTITGEARATSTAVSRSSWYSDCTVTISSGTASSSGCGEGMTSSVGRNYLVFTTVPATVGLAVTTSGVMQTVAGGLVSTNAQGMTFGDETMAGTSFEFAVAGPSYTASDASRSADGFYYVCVPAAFLSGSFGTTAADAATSWQGTRDGSIVSTSFGTGTCGLGDTGLVASLDPYGYSAPLFRVRPPAAPGGSSSSSSGSAATTTPATTETDATQAVVETSTPAAAPITAASIYPTSVVGKRLKAKYLARLAGLKRTTGPAIKVSVPQMFRSVCRTSGATVVALSPGTCGVKVKYRTPSGKKRAERVYLTIR